jgi:hypothetical protein
MQQRHLAGIESPHYGTFVVVSAYCLEDYSSCIQKNKKKKDYPKRKYPKKERNLKNKTDVSDKYIVARLEDYSSCIKKGNNQIQKSEKQKSSLSPRRLFLL